VVQLTLAKNWSNIGQVLTNYKVKFRGLYPKNSSEIIQLSSRPLRIEIASYLRNEECEAAVHWKHHIQPLRPAENQIENVKQSFGLLKPIFQIVLTYNFHQVRNTYFKIENCFSSIKANFLTVLCQVLLQLEVW